MNREHARIKATLRNHNKGIINPRNSKWVPYWDSVTFACLLYTAILTPVEVCVVRPTESQEVGFLFVVNRMVDFFFSIDLVINFFLAYQESPKRGSRWVTDRQQIVRHYLSTWFVLDLVSVLPFDLFTWSGLIPANGSSKVLQMLRIIRLLRLVKLLRIIRASRIFARWQSFFGFTYAEMTMMKFIVLTIMMMHAMACCWAYLGLNWSPTPGISLETETTWVDKYGFTGYTTTRLYAISLYVATVSMFGGVGSITPQNYPEYILLTAMMIGGSLVWAWVIGSLCGILATLNPSLQGFHNTMDELNAFIKERDISSTMAVRLRDYFRATQDFNRLASYDKLMAMMSTQLRGDTALIIAQATLQKVWYLSINDVEKEYLALVAISLKYSCYAVRELVSIQDLTIITKGMAARKLRIMSVGTVLGTDAILPTKHYGLRDLDPASCLTFVETSTISRDSLFELADSYPVAKAHLQRTSRLVMLSLALRKFYRRWKDSHRNTSGSLIRSSLMDNRQRQLTANASLAKWESQNRKHGTSDATGIDKALKQIRKGLFEQGKKGEAQGARIDQMARQQEMLHQKVDTMLGILMIQQGSPPLGAFDEPSFNSAHSDEPSFAASPPARTLSSFAPSVFATGVSPPNIVSHSSEAKSGTVLGAARLVARDDGAGGSPLKQKIRVPGRTTKKVHTRGHRSASVPSVANGAASLVTTSPSGSATTDVMNRTAVGGPTATAAHLDSEKPFLSIYEA